MAVQVQVESASAGDIAAIRRLLVKVGLPFWRHHWQNFLVVRDGGRIVGAGQVKAYHGGTHELGSIAVDAAYRGRGIARAVLERLLEDRQEDVYLVCETHNQALYERFGFEVISIDSVPNDYRPHVRLISTLAAIDRLVRRRDPVVAMRRPGGR